MNATGPWIKSFSYNVSERKNHFPARATSLCAVYMFSPYLHGFLPVLQCPPTSQRCGYEVNWHVKIVPVWKNVCVCVWCTLWWKGILSRVGACLVPRAAGMDWPSGTLNLNKWVGKEFSYLFFLIFLKYMCVCVCVTFISVFDIRSARVFI